MAHFGDVSGRCDLLVSLGTHEPAGGYLECVLASQESVPDAVAPPPRHPRFPLVDGLRAIAVLSVLLVHVSVYGLATGGTASGRLLSHLNVGVTVFFLISGFLLYRPFIAARAGGAGRPGVPDYAKRRILRIYPAYFVVLTALTVLPGLTGVVSGEGLSQYALLWSLPLREGNGCFAPSSGCGLAQTWSLVAEVTFYAVLPLYALSVARLTRGFSRTAWITAELTILTVLAAASVAATVLAGPDPRSWIAGSLLGYGLWFALGMAFALLSVTVREGGARPSWVRFLARRAWLPWLAAAAVYVAFSQSVPGTPFLLTDSDRLLAHLVFALVATLLLFPAIFAEEQRAGARSGSVAGAQRGIVAGLLGNPVVSWLGLISYGIFLWHFVVAFELGFIGSGHGFWFILAATLSISIACAAASYYLVEKPLLALKYRKLRDLPGMARARRGEAG